MSTTTIVVHAHPDDEAIFTGTTIRRLADDGQRVVLVVATAGEEGVPRIRLRRGETVGTRRLAELEEACATLGVARLVLLGGRDSGFTGGAAAHPDALVGADTLVVGRRLADLCDAESAGSLVHYAPDGITGHPDHLAVHRFTSVAATLTGLTTYESTLDRAGLVPDHLAGPDLPGAPDGAAITTVVRATEAEIVVKRTAFAAHSSQIDLAQVTRPDFAEAYGTEWFVRRGAAAAIDGIALTPLFRSTSAA